MTVRRGPGLLGTMARTAVVAGTASAVSGGVNRRQRQKYAAQDVENAKHSQPPEYSQPAEQQYAAASTAAAQESPGGSDDIERLKKLGELRDAGVLTEEEFSAEKAKVLNG